MKSDPRRLARDAPPVNAGLGFEGRILRLVKGGAERRAIEAGQIDAVMDPASGNVLLLPAAQAALRDNEARVGSLLALSSDCCWEQDEFYRFISHTGAASGGSGIYDENIIGKTLWNLPFDNMSEADWQAHRRQLERRATFRDFELRCMDRAGEVRWVSLSGEPTFDEQDQFKGFRGIMRNITLRKRSEVLAQKPIRFVCDTLDALAVQVYVLDSAGSNHGEQAIRSFRHRQQGHRVEYPRGREFSRDVRQGPRQGARGRRRDRSRDPSGDCRR